MFTGWLPERYSPFEAHHPLWGIETALTAVSGLRSADPRSKTANAFAEHREGAAVIPERAPGDAIADHADQMVHSLVARLPVDRFVQEPEPLLGSKLTRAWLEHDATKASGGTYGCSREHVRRPRARDGMCRREPGSRREGPSVTNGV